VNDAMITDVQRTDRSQAMEQMGKIQPAVGMGGKLDF
jgi:hypothetical protein